MTRPTYLTILRVIAVPFIIIALIYYRAGKNYWQWIALGLFALSCISDALDGYLARKWNEHSKLGAFLDPLADKILLVSAYICIFFSPHFVLKPPAWFIILIVSRDVLIVASLGAIFASAHNIPVKPSYLGKATTLFQMITLALLIIQFKIAIIFWNVTAILTILSGIHYAYLGIKKTKKQTS